MKREREGLVVITGCLTGVVDRAEDESVGPPDPAEAPAGTRQARTNTLMILAQIELELVSFTANFIYEVAVDWPEACKLPPPPPL